MLGIFCMFFAMAGNAAQKVNLFRVVVSGKWGYIDKTGKVKISPQFEDAQDFVDGPPR